MTAAVVVFPGSNCDRDLKVALETAMGRPPAMVWHKEAALPAGTRLVAIPGGFSFGDYLRSGAIAARAPIMAAVKDHVAAGGLVLGICNGWQVLIEAGHLPGALMRNAGLRFVCRDVHLRVETLESPFTAGDAAGQVVRFPVAHHDGAFVAEADLIARLEGEGRVAFRYVDGSGARRAGANPNGSVADIAGVLSETGRVLGLMPHPERLADPALGGTDGAVLFRSVVERLAVAA
ncbi:MAG: phosphoribosylformylglycinamidine synthase subunit PurQ [Paracoccaceae bacterium]